jgi:hypothetical protein
MSQASPSAHHSGTNHLPRSVIGGASLRRLHSSQYRPGHRGPQTGVSKPGRQHRCTLCRANLFAWMHAFLGHRCMPRPRPVPLQTTMALGPRLPGPSKPQLGLVQRYSAGAHHPMPPESEPSSLSDCLSRALQLGRCAHQEKQKKNHDSNKTG